MWFLFLGIAAAYSPVNPDESWVVYQEPIGMHVDIEPHALPEWDDDMNGTANSWLDLLESLSGILSPTSLKLSVDVPRWYDSRYVFRDGEMRRLSELAALRCDTLTLMDYVDDGTRLYNDALNELDFGVGEGKTVVVGVETGCNISPETVTFCEEGTAYMEQQLASSKKKFDQKSSFAGFAVHSVKSWKAMNPPPLAPAERDVWVWQVSEWSYPSDTQDAHLEWAKSRGVRCLYLEQMALMRNDREVSAHVLNQTALYGLQVEFMFAKHISALPQNHWEPLEFAWLLRNFTTQLIVEEMPLPSKDSSGKVAPSWWLLIVVSVVFLLNYSGKEPLGIQRGG